MRRLRLTCSGIACIVLLVPFAAHSANILGDQGNANAAYIGLSTAPVSPAVAEQLGLQSGMGLTVKAVDPEGPCSGLVARHDILQKLDGQILFNREQFTGILSTFKPDQAITLSVLRKSKTVAVEVRLSDFPVDMPAHPYWYNPHRFKLPVSADDAATSASDLPGRLNGASIDDILAHIRKSHDRRIEIQEADEPDMDAFIGDVREKLESVRWSPPMSPKDYQRRRKPEPLATNDIYYASEYETLSISDDEMSARMVLGDDGSFLIVQDEEGNIVFEGPVNTREERMRIPGKAFKYMDHLEQLREDSGDPAID